MVEWRVEFSGGDSVIDGGASVLLSGGLVRGMREWCDATKFSALIIKWKLIVVHLGDEYLRDPRILTVDSCGPNTTVAGMIQCAIPHRRIMTQCCRIARVAERAHDADMIH